MVSGNIYEGVKMVVVLLMSLDGVGSSFEFTFPSEQKGE